MWFLEKHQKLEQYYSNKQKEKDKFLSSSKYKLDLKKEKDQQQEYLKALNL